VSRLFGRGRNRRRRAASERRRLVRRWGALALQGAVTIGVLQWLLPDAVAFAKTHPYFALREVEVRHRGHLPDETVRAATGLRLGMSIWDVDVDAVRTALGRLPWVRSVEVERRLPGRVSIRLREHRPAAIVRLDGAESPLRYVATNGRVIATVGEVDGRDLPYISGLDADRVEHGTAVHQIRAALHALHTAARYRAAIGVVSEVHVDDTSGITVLPMRPAIPIEVGWTDVDATLGRVAEVLPHWLDRADDVRSVRGLDGDQVIVRLRTIPKEWGT